MNPWGLALGGQNKIFLADDNEHDGCERSDLRVNIDKKKVDAAREWRQALVDPTGLQLGPGGDLYTADYGGGP